MSTERSAPGRRAGAGAAQLLRNLHRLPREALRPVQGSPSHPELYAPSPVMWGSPRTHRGWLRCRPRGITWGRREEDEVPPPPCTPPNQKPNRKGGPRDEVLFSPPVKSSPLSSFNIRQSPPLLKLFQTSPTNPDCATPHHPRPVQSNTQ